MPSPKMPTNYRTLMQHLARKRFDMSPRKRMEKGAAQMAGTAATMNGAENQQPQPSTAGAASDSSMLTSSATSATTNSPASTGAVRTQPDALTTGAKVTLDSLRRFALQSQYASLPNFQPERVKEVADQLRDRVRMAMNAAVEATQRTVDSSGFDARRLSPAEAARGVVKSHRRNYSSSTPFDERWDSISKNLAVLGMTSTGNTVVPYPDSADAFEAMWREVDSATKEVLWQTYICKDDYVGQRTVSKLAQAHRRGCQTELLYDCGGNISGRSRLTEELRQCGARVIPYRPFFRSMFHYLTQLDWKISPGLRNHRKILLVDGRIGFCGGLNVGEEYCGARMGGSGAFRDTHCSVVGPAVEHLRGVYDDTKRPQPWKYGWTRFRQIAAMQVERTVQQSSDVLDTNKQALQLFQDKTASMTRSGRVYFHKQLRRAERGIYPVIGRMGLRKQQEEKIVAMMQYYKNRLVGDAFEKALKLTAEACPPPERARAATETQPNKASPASTPTGTPTSASTPVGSTVNPAEEVIKRVDATRTASTSGEARRVDTATDTLDDGAAESTKSPPQATTRSRAMKRRTRDERVRSLYKATNLAHKRAYTSMILSVPIEDTEPVPEAALYSELRPSTTQILACNPRFRNYAIQYAFWQVTRKCHRRIWITTPYYLPTRKLFKAMVQAAKRGVDVRLLAGSNQTTDPWFMWHASNHITQTLLRAGVRIYEFKGSQIMHGKTVVVDSIWSSIGSYNWDVMSNKNLEVCLCHLDADFARKMEAQFLRDLAQSEEVKQELHEKRSLWLRFTSWLFYNMVFVMDRITFRSFTNQDVKDSPDIPRD